MNCLVHVVVYNTLLHAYFPINCFIFDEQLTHARLHMHAVTTSCLVHDYELFSACCLLMKHILPYLGRWPDVYCCQLQLHMIANNHD